MRAHQLKWPTGAALAITLLSLYPQYVMWWTRGHNWNGAFAQVHGDEWLYSAYVEALIDGRPRRNDSYTGRDDRPGKTQPESLFSIQFVPAYVIAIPARILGISSSTAFIVLGFLTPLLSALALYWLLFSIYKDEKLAAAASLVVLCLGALAGGQGAVHLLIPNSQYVYLPFLRRYEPAAMFPLFFVFCAFVWKSVTSDGRNAVALAFAAGLSLDVLVFSYFYLWTAGIAWLLSLTLLRLIGSRSLKSNLLKFAIMWSVIIAALIPYSILLSHRSHAMDAGQKLNLSHAPDIFRAPELLAFAALILLAACAIRGFLAWRRQDVLFAGSFLISPFIVFNQQVLTGRSLQPFHFELFIANYIALVGAVLVTMILVSQKTEKTRPLISNQWLARLVFLALWWAAVELVLHSKVMVAESVFKDRTAAVCKELRQLSANDHVNIDQRNPLPLVFATDDDLAIMIPTFAPQALLWAPNFDFLDLEPSENRERLYQYLYYSGIDGPALAQDLALPHSRFAPALFGHERVIPYLSIAPVRRITQEEIAAEAKSYDAYLASFSRDDAERYLISYVVFPVRRQPNLANLDRWYLRDKGEQVDAYMIHRISLRQ